MDIQELMTKLRESSERRVRSSEEVQAQIEALDEGAPTSAIEALSFAQKSLTKAQQEDWELIVNIVRYLAGREYDLPRLVPVED